jgi:hypothetical protein
VCVSALPRFAATLAHLDLSIVLDTAAFVAEHCRRRFHRFCTRMAAALPLLGALTHLTVAAEQKGGLYWTARLARDDAADLFPDVEWRSASLRSLKFGVADYYQPWPAHIEAPALTAYDACDIGTDTLQRLLRRSPLLTDLNVSVTKISSRVRARRGAINSTEGVGAESGGGDPQPATYDLTALAAAIDGMGARPMRAVELYAEDSGVVLAAAIARNWRGVEQLAYIVNAGDGDVTALLFLEAYCATLRACRLHDDRLFSVAAITLPPLPVPARVSREAQLEYMRATEEACAREHAAWMATAAVAASPSGSDSSRCSWVRPLPRRQPIVMERLTTLSLRYHGAQRLPAPPPTPTAEKGEIENHDTVTVGCGDDDDEDTATRAITDLPANTDWQQHQQRTVGVGVRDGGGGGGGGDLQVKIDAGLRHLRWPALDNVCLDIALGPAAVAAVVSRIERASTRVVITALPGFKVDGDAEWGKPFPDSASWRGHSKVNDGGGDGDHGSGCGDGKGERKISVPIGNGSEGGDDGVSRHGGGCGGQCGGCGGQCGDDGGGQGGGGGGQGGEDDDIPRQAALRVASVTDLTLPANFPSQHLAALVSWTPHLACLRFAVPVGEFAAAVIGQRSSPTGGGGQRSSPTGGGDPKPSCFPTHALLSITRLTKVIVAGRLPQLERLALYGPGYDLEPRPETETEFLALAAALAPSVKILVPLHTHSRLRSVLGVPQ